VESEPGKGSTFTVVLPRQVDAKPAAIAPEEASRPTGSGAEILVIDDEVTARDLIYRALTKEGYRVTTAGSGQEGLVLARKLKPAMITLDVMMPGMDGWSVLSALKADPETVVIPVIMVSVVDERNLGFALGAADYLLKPIDWERLGATLKRLRPRLQGCTVLVIEDDPSTREMLRRTTEKQGWSVLEAENGRIGLERILEKIPDVILLDLMMPEMDGFTFVEELRRRPDYRDIPVIVVTAKDLTPEDRQRLNGQVIRILEKGGYSTIELLEEMRKVLAATSHLAGGI